MLGTPAKTSNKYKYTYTKKQLLEIGEPKPVVDWMNVVQKYEMLSISIVVRMQRLSNSPSLSDVHNQTANTALSYVDKTRASA